MKKKGVSPIIATVVLIGIVIVIALFLWFWYGKFIEGRIEKLDTALSQECVQNTEIQVNSGSCIFNATTSEYMIDMEISNSGMSKITELLFSISSESNSITKEAGKVIDAGTSADLTILINQTDLNNEAPTEVKIVPAISKETTLKYCDGQAEYFVISSC